MNPRSYGALVIDGKILMIRSSVPHQPDSWIVPGGEHTKDEKPEDAIIRMYGEQTGLVVFSRRLMFEDLDEDGKVLLTFGRIELEEDDPKDPRALLTDLAGERADNLRWMPLETARTNPMVGRMLPLLNCTLWIDPKKIPFNWVRLPEQPDRELAHRIRRTERYMRLIESFRNEPDVVGHALIQMQDHLESRPFALWRFVERWGNHPHHAIRLYVSIWILEHLIEQHFELLIARLEELCRRDPLYGDMFLYAWIGGKAKRPANRARLLRLKQSVLQDGRRRFSRHSGIPDRFVIFGRRWGQT